MEQGSGLVTYLDLVSHYLYGVSASAYDSARRVVESAGRHDVIISRSTSQNMATALTATIGLVAADQ